MRGIRRGGRICCALGCFHFSFRSEAAFERA